MRKLASSWNSILAVLALGAGACVGTVGGSGPGSGNNGSPDAGVSTPDAAPAPVDIQVQGMTMDYFGAVALPNTAYATQGMTPAISGTSGTDGSFTLDQVPPASAFYVDVTRDQTYRPTRNDVINVTDKSVMANLYAVSVVDAQRQYVTLGMTPTAGQAVVFADLRRNNGTPLEGVAITDISLVDAQGNPVPNVLGPYFFGANGDVVPNATLAVSTAYNGSARMAYLDVPPGSWTLKVNYIGGTGAGGGGGTGGGSGSGSGSGTGTPMTMVVPVMTVADGATLVSTGHQDDDGTTGTTTALSFTTDIYPLLQRAALGGQGCANCHNGTTLAGGLAYDGPAADVYSLIMGTAGVVDLTTPSDSLLLTKPLYEDPPNHPNATWLTTSDPAYMQVLAWITQGAKQ